MTDTALKRSSAIATATVVQLFPVPDGDITSFGDRLHIAGSYRVTAVDAVAPVYSVTPIAGSTLDSSVRITGEVTDNNPPITFYIVALADAAAAPSEEQIQAGTDAADGAVLNASQTYTESPGAINLQINGLSPSTAYDIYYTAVDLFGNLSTAAKIDVTTIATPTPSSTLGMTYNLAYSVIQELAEEL